MGVESWVAAGIGYLKYCGRTRGRARRASWKDNEHPISAESNLLRSDLLRLLFNKDPSQARRITARHPRRPPMMAPIFVVFFLHVNQYGKGRVEIKKFDVPDCGYRSKRTVIGCEV